jgi:hypothetical protein
MLLESKALVKLNLPRHNHYEVHCEEKLKLRSRITSYCLIEAVTKAGLTVLIAE